jgi:hypothetical protein
MAYKCWAVQIFFRPRDGPFGMQLEARVVLTCFAMEQRGWQGRRGAANTTVGPQSWRYDACPLSMPEEEVLDDTIRHTAKVH